MPIVSIENVGVIGNSSSWSLRVGEPTTDCHGTFLHKYINGTMVGNYKLSVSGQVIDFPQADGHNCLMATVAGAFGVLG